MRRNVFVQCYAEVVRDDILSALYMLRQLGWKTMAGLDRIARHCGVTPRRTKTIVMRDMPHVVTADQRRHFALAIADLHDRLADEFEERAQACRDKGDGIRFRERQQLLLPLEVGAWRSSGNLRQRRAA